MGFDHTTDDFGELERILMLPSSSSSSVSSTLEADYPMYDDFLNTVKHERKQSIDGLLGGFAWMANPSLIGTSMLQVDAPKATSTAPLSVHGPNANAGVPPPSTTTTIVDNTMTTSSSGAAMVPSAVVVPATQLSLATLPALPSLQATSDKLQRKAKAPLVLLRQCKGRSKLFEDFSAFVYDSDAQHEACKGSTDSRRSEFCPSCRRLKRILVNRKMRFNKNPTSMHVAKKYLTPLREAKQTQHYHDELKQTRRKVLEARRKVEAIRDALSHNQLQGGCVDELAKLVDHVLEELC